ncbi:MAG TPA: selenide, water dikinase SelD [Lachnospiraceae bacterium]|nr:selenide, water dikinase SelD [Lachnospiraceae bacterium]
MADIEFCKGGGCTAKLGPGALERILSKIERGRDPDLLIGFDSKDDAAVYRLTDDLAVVETLDFFPPMIEDPFVFGEIAAANAMSDVWAMGGDVRTALNIVCFPESMDLNILGKIIQGGNAKVLEAGGVLAGGHSIADSDVKYGLSVFGTVDPRKILPNNAARPGDVLILTKPLGTGLVCTAGRVGAASEGAMRKAVRSMTTLNKYAAGVLKHHSIHACTDVTGFGLLVHLSEMLGDSFSARISCEKVPVIEEAFSYASDFYITAAGQRNRVHMDGKVAFDAKIPFEMQEILFDPQTSGGLLLAVPETEASPVYAEIASFGLPCGIIGTVTEKKDKMIFVGK